MVPSWPICRKPSMSFKTLVLMYTSQACASILHAFAVKKRPAAATHRHIMLCSCDMLLCQWRCWFGTLQWNQCTGLAMKCCRRAQNAQLALHMCQLILLFLQHLLLFLQQQAWLLKRQTVKVQAVESTSNNASSPPEMLVMSRALLRFAN